MAQRVVAYDTETTGLCPHLDGVDMFAYSTCTEDGETTVQRLDGSPVRQAQGRKRLRRLWADRATAKVCHNLKFDLGFTEKFLGEDLSDAPAHCTYLQSHILQNNHRTHGLKQLSWELSGYPREDDAAIHRYVTANTVNYQQVPEHMMDKYQANDAERAMLLHLFFYPKILANAQYREIYQVELDLVRTTLKMERRGLMLNRKRCRQMIAQLEADVAQIRREFRAYAERETGMSFSPSQTGKVADLLFNRLGLPVIGRTKKSGKPSTDKDLVLLPLRESNPHPVLDLILKYRSWSRGISMLQSYLGFADDDDIIHPDINTCGARTGRESCSRPNLQNVEKTGVLKNPFPVPARRVFRPRPGFINFHIDYSGIEMVLLIHYSGDEKLLKEARDPNGDVHLPAACVFYPVFTVEERKAWPSVDALIQAGFTAFGKDDPEWKTLRDATKNANFAIPYGAAAPRMSSTLNIPLGLGKKRYQVYRREFPKLCELNRLVAREARRLGYVETVFGRTLHVNRDKAYVGTNFLIQGTAAGILKRAQVRVSRYLERATGGEVQLLLPIHDELVVECPRDRLRDAPDFLRDVRELMTDFPMFKVPLKIDISVATVDWEHKAPFPLRA